MSRTKVLPEPLTAKPLPPWPRWMSCLPLSRRKPPTVQSPTVSTPRFTGTTKRPPALYCPGTMGQTRAVLALAVMPARSPCKWRATSPVTIRGRRKISPSLTSATSQQQPMMKIVLPSTAAKARLSTSILASSTPTQPPIPPTKESMYSIAPTSFRRNMIHRRQLLCSHGTPMMPLLSIWATKTMQRPRNIQTRLPLTKMSENSRPLTPPRTTSS